MQSNFSQVLEDFLSSEKCLFMLSKNHSSYRPQIIGLLVEYAILHKDLFEIEKYQIFLHDRFSKMDPSIVRNYYNIEGKADFLRGSVEHKIGTIDAQTVDRYIKNEFYEEGFLYHSTNPSSLVSIKEKGLDPSYRMWSEKDLERIRSIFRQFGVHSILGFSAINSQDRIWISDNFQSLYKYASTSPEWFSYFLTGPHIPRLTPYDASAFHRRDKAASLGNIVLFMDMIASGEYQLYQQNIISDLKAQGADINVFYLEIKEIYDTRIDKTLDLDEAFRIVMYEHETSFSRIDTKRFSPWQRGYIFMRLYEMFLGMPENVSTLGASEKQETIDFFEKYWELFGENSFLTLLINRNALNFTNNEGLISSMPELAITERIDTHDITVLNLPVYDQIMKLD